MKAAFLYGKRDLRLMDAPAPELGPDDVLVRVRAAFVCGTDVRLLENGSERITERTPLAPGHEMSGVVEAVGSRVTVCRPGQRVAVGPNMGCGTCAHCIAGSTHLCRDYRALGIHLPGAFAEFVRVPEAAVRQGNLFEIAPRLSFEEAALAEPLSCVVNAFERLRVGPGESALIFGAGPLGLLHAKMARLAGASPVLVADPNAERLEASRTIDPQLVPIGGPDVKSGVRDATRGRGVDVCITACPSPEAQAAALDLAAVNGRVLFFGGLPAGKALVPLDTNLIHYKQLMVTGTARASLAQIRRSLRLLEDALIRVADLISTRSPLEEIHAAFRKAAQGIGLKHAIVFG
jgi:L-iditol 2-dehydrogenase